MPETNVLSEIQDRVLKITLNRVEKKNALTQAMYQRLTELLTNADENSEIRAVFITGDASVFSAGNDIADFKNQKPFDPDSSVIQFLNVLFNLEKPLIAAANGPCVGIGTTLLLHCDLVFLGEQARLQTPFVDLGLCPEAASSFLLPLYVGHARASQLLLLGDAIDAHTAQSWGLANQVLSADIYQEKAWQAAKTIAKKPPASVRITKKLLRENFKTSMLQTLRTEIDIFSNRLQSPEAKEAFSAFMEKRAPDFSRFE